MTTPCTCQHLTSESARADGNGDLLTAERAESARLRAALEDTLDLLQREGTHRVGVAWAIQRAANGLGLDR